jgi:PAB-dependent poly(A)-specific ribonuclease subunit 2
MKDLRCMSFISKDTKEIIVAGLQDQMFVINVDKGEITKQVRCNPTNSNQPADDIDQN